MFIVDYILSTMSWHISRNFVCYSVWILLRTVGKVLWPSHTIQNKTAQVKYTRLVVLDTKSVSHATKIVSCAVAINSIQFM